MGGIVDVYRRASEVWQEITRDAAYKEYTGRIEARGITLFDPLDTEVKDTTGYVCVCLFRDGFPSERFLVGRPGATPHEVNTGTKECSCGTKGDTCKHLFGLTWWLEHHEYTLKPIKGKTDRAIVIWCERKDK